MSHCHMEKNDARFEKENFTHALKETAEQTNEKTTGFFFD